MKGPEFMPEAILCLSSRAASSDVVGDLLDNLYQPVEHASSNPMFLKLHAFSQVLRRGEIDDVQELFGYGSAVYTICEDAVLNRRRND